MKNPRDIKNGARRAAMMPSDVGEITFVSMLLIIRVGSSS